MRLTDANLLRSIDGGYIPPVKILFDSILTINENLFVKKESTKLFLSEDYGETYNKSIDITSIGDIRTIHIFPNKNMLVCGRQKAYYIDENWLQIKQSIILNADGSQWVAQLTNDNFMSLHGISNQKVGDKDILVWGNYNNDQNSVNNYNAVAEVFYTVDYGKTIKVLFSSGISTANNWEGILYCRHIHHVSQNQYDESFWIQTGDEPREIMSHWIQAVYNLNNDTFTLNHIGAGTDFKTTNLFFYNEWVYYAKDVSNGGLCKVKISEAGDSSKHQQVINLGTDLGGIVVGKSGQVALIPTKYFNASYDGRKITYSRDLIEWYTVNGDVPEGSTFDTIYGRLFQPNSKGQALASIQPYYNQKMYLYNYFPSVFINEILEKNGFNNPFL